MIIIFPLTALAWERLPGTRWNMITPDSMWTWSTMTSFFFFLLFHEIHRVWPRYTKIRASVANAIHYGVPNSLLSSSPQFSKPALFTFASLIDKDNIHFVKVPSLHHSPTTPAPPPTCCIGLPGIIWFTYLQVVFVTQGTKTNTKDKHILCICTWQHHAARPTFAPFRHIWLPMTKVSLSHTRLSFCFTKTCTGNVRQAKAPRNTAAHCMNSRRKTGIQSAQIRTSSRAPRECIM